MLSICYGGTIRSRPSAKMMHGRGLHSARKGRVMPVCELCGSNDFVKTDGMFVCQGCQTKYTLEEAKKLPTSAPAGVPAPGDSNAPAAPTPAPTPAPAPSAAQDVPSAHGAISGLAAVAIGALLEALKAPQDFQPEVAGNAKDDARTLNNYIAQGWQMVIDEYRKLEHPTREDLDKVVVRAKECLVALDNAAKIEPDKYVQNALIYTNCLEVVDSVRDLSCYEQKDGEWKRVLLPLGSSALDIPGQGESWKSKRDAHAASIEEEYLQMHPEEVSLRQDLEAQEAKISAQLDELKDEKRSKGFFNFSEKREVKERMAPVKEQLGQVQKQLRVLDGSVDAYVNERLGDLAKSFTLLRF